MLSKRYRQIRFFKATLEWNKELSSSLDIHSLWDVLLHIHATFHSNGIILKKYYKDRVSVSLRDIKYHRTNKTMSLLIGVGDKDAADPAFMTDDGSGTRIERANLNESLGVATHLNFCLTPYSSNFYILTKDYVKDVPNSLIFRFINYVLAKYIKYEFEYDNSTYRIRPRIKFEELASKTLREALADKKPIGIEVFRTSYKTQNFDENYSLKKTNKRAFISFPVEWNGNDLCTNLKDLLPFVKNSYTDLTLRCTKDKKRHSYNFSLDELSREDIETYLFADRENIRLTSDIEQLPETIHTELDSKMYTHTIARHRELAR